MLAHDVEQAEKGVGGFRCCRRVAPDIELHRFDVAGEQRARFPTSQSTSAFNIHTTSLTRAL